MKTTMSKEEMDTLTVLVDHFTAKSAALFFARKLFIAGKDDKAIEALRTVGYAKFFGFDEKEAA